MNSNIKTQNMWHCVNDCSQVKVGYETENLEEEKKPKMKQKLIFGTSTSDIFI